MNTPANARQVAGTHYRTKYQHWDFVPRAGLGYFEGQITKYITRHRSKNGRQDVEKAMHFCEKLIELAKVGAVRPSGVPVATVLPEVKNFCEANDLKWHEMTVVHCCTIWFTLVDLERIQHHIQCILDKQYPLDDAGPTPGYVNQDR